MNLKLFSKKWGLIFGKLLKLPAPNLLGSCLFIQDLVLEVTVSPFYLTWKARQYGGDSRFIQLAGVVNLSMPEYVVQKIEFGLDKEGKNFSTSRILLLGLAYKKNVDDDRESVTFKVMELLTKQGAQVDYNDPYIPFIKPRREYKQFVGKKSVTLENIDQYDIAVILTDHSTYDFEKITGKKFDLEEFKKTPQFYYQGTKDKSNPFRRGAEDLTDEEYEIVKKLFVDGLPFEDKPVSLKVSTSMWKNSQKIY